MQYLGGKWKAGAEYARRIAPEGAWWEPFCGGLNVSMHLAKYPYPGTISDINPDLIALFQAVREGWEPPTECTIEQWREAKNCRISSHLRTFIGFGCSYGGSWFNGYAKPGTYTYASSGQTQTRNYCAEFAKALILQVRAVANCTLKCTSFFDESPTPGIYEVIFADPPYEGTKGYRVMFDHTKFWRLCQEWANTGTRVLVSEYQCPVPNRLLWSRSRKSQIGSGSDIRTECLFQLDPPSLVRPPT